MTTTPFHHATPADFSALCQHADTAFDDLSIVDEVYFIGDHTDTFA
jgi:hypothetical protein